MWVVRQPDPDDGRVKRVVPTKQATEVWEKVSRAGREVLDQAYQGVHPTEIETVKRVLGRVRRNLGPKPPPVRRWRIHRRNPLPR